MSITEIALLLGAGIFSSALNAVVGGGSFITFPTLIFLGMPPIQANATSTVALWPGTLASLWAQRRELAKNTKKLPVFVPLSLLGGGIGAFVVIHISNDHFAGIVPYMLLVATLLFTFRPQLIRWVLGFSARKGLGVVSYWSAVVITQLLISIYGGFFGAGMGIMFLAFLGMIGMHNMHEANAVRNCSGACINSIATLIFIASGKVIWLHMAIMCAGAMVGGYFCAHYARKLPSEWLRKAVVVIAWVMTICFFWKQLL